MDSMSRKSLRHFIYLSWAIPGLLALVASGFTFSLLGWMDYRNTVSRIEDDLRDKSVLVARRLSAEILLGPDSAADAVARSLQSELGIKSITVIGSPPPCLTSYEFCFIHENGNLKLFRKIIHVPAGNYLSIVQPSPNLFQSLDFKLLFWSVLPVFIVLGAGLFLQRYFLRKYVVQPIDALVETAIADKNPDDHWPSEFVDISKRLSESFQQRDQAVIGQLTSGIIHDIKTPLQSIVAALFLLDKKSSSGDSRHLDRLENLAARCRDNLPNIGRIIETTLDMNRRINVTKETEDLVATVRSAIDLNRERCGLRKGKIELAAPESCFVPHDPVQISRVIDNLIKNGIEALDDVEREPMISISVIPVESGGTAIAVEDNGPGLPRSPERMFRAFRSSKVHGTGLGLHISKRIVEAHDGKLVASNESTLGGARFDVMLPDHTVHGEAPYEAAP